MGYRDYLAGLLRPLGVYDLSQESFSGAELAALGAALDAAQAQLETVLREALLETAQGLGLERYEALLTHRPPTQTAAQRRAALEALLRMNGTSAAALNAALAGCGVRARVDETQTAGVLQVSFPEQMGIPARIGEIQALVEDILPCHLAAAYFYRYLLWGDTQMLGITWGHVDGMTWEELTVYDIYA